MAHIGGCLCGNVRFEIDAEPIASRMCWCRDCQRIASGSATVNIVFPFESVDFTGDVTTFDRVADSGNMVRRGFCTHCGTQIYSRTLSPDNQPIRIRTGVIDDKELIAPGAVIWVDSAPSWAPLDPNLPHHPKGPDSPAIAR